MGGGGHLLSLLLLLLSFAVGAANSGARSVSRPRADLHALEFVGS